MLLQERTKMKNNLTTTQSTDLVLKKSKATLGIVKRILSSTKSLTTKSNKDVILSPDVMMINGLMWQKETVEEEMQWEEAMEYAENLSLGGYDDWSLPTIEEFREVVRSFGGIDVSLEDDDWKSIIIIKNFMKKKVLPLATIGVLLPV